MSKNISSENKDARMALTSASNEGASPKIQYALVRDGKHIHLYFRTDKTKEWLPGPCLGGVPEGMFCDWNIGPTDFVQHRFRNEDTMYRYLLKRLSQQQAFDMLEDVKRRVNEFEREMVEA
jgi:hypothetical protein